MNTTLVHCNIVNCPSKMDLIAALAYAYDKKHPHEVIFVVEPDGCAEKLELQMRIEAMRHEDTSGDSFVFIANWLTPRSEANVLNLVGAGVKAEVSVADWCYCNTRTRTGWIKLVIKDK